MFTAFFVLTLVSKKIKIGHDLYDLFRDPFYNFQDGARKTQGNSTNRQSNDCTSCKNW